MCIRWVIVTNRGPIGLQDFFYYLMAHKGRVQPPTTCKEVFSSIKVIG